MDIFTKVNALNAGANESAELVEVVLDGKLKDYSEYIEAKKIIRDSVRNGAVRLYFINATSIDAYILGYILKLREVDKITISIIVGNSRLYEFLRHIDFGAFFDIKIKEYKG